ncbi:hypothetical protein CWE13_07360 [Aliidiomarina shirensis]|uniref:DUF4062 domain-containing protein n=1 Tax=Aliidiomarina shirensis TaxID=1048642 RepID=A0A432WVG0_9GAMM|nr:DUF4062 domain-containing protein [Aliidiomarina shirensis]RUO37755.1 hypothetical protein CWE13_07360 [Aliidiomarina shirensis]
MKKVFLSSTFLDLKKERQAIAKALKEEFDNLEIIGMEEFGARTEKPLQVCVTEVATADIYIGIIGEKYGSIDIDSGKSFTEIEYASFSGEAAFIFIKSGVDFSEKGVNFRAFVELLKNNHTPDFWNDSSDLIWRVPKAVRQKLNYGQVETALPPDIYSIHVMGERGLETKIVEYKETEKVAFNANAGDHIIRWASFVSHTRPFCCTYDFSKGKLPTRFEFSRSSGSFARNPRTGVWTAIPVDAPHFEKFSDNTFGLRLEPQRTNFLHKFSYARPRQVVSLKRGEYTVWVEGSGSLSIKGVIRATVSSHQDLHFCIHGDEQCSLVIDAIGKINHAQLEDGFGRTSRILTENTAITRLRDFLHLKQ